MSRLTIADDLYAVMEIERSASAEDIKIAYRRLAQQHHPDCNPGDDQAEERFKRLQQAYSILSDPERRAKYDQIRAASNPEPVPAFMDDFFSSIGEFFEEIFGSGGNVVHLSLERALRGGPIMIRGKDGSLTRIVLPPGIKNKFRIRASDEPGSRVFTFRILPHPVFTRKRNNLLMQLSVTSLDALLGCTQTVTDPYGDILTIDVPPNSKPGTRLRLVGHGVRSNKKRPGDLLIDLDISPMNSEDRQTLYQAALAAGLIQR